MEDWHIANPNWKAHVVLACITCENVVLLTTKAEILQTKPQTMNLFLPTLCVSCEKDERRPVAFGQSGIGSATALWTSLSISHGIIRTWQPFLEMKAFLGGELSMPTTKVKLVRRDEVRDKVGSDYIVQSVLLDHGTGGRSTSASISPERVLLARELLGGPRSSVLALSTTRNMYLAA
jgi:hypothetical protein